MSLHDLHIVLMRPNEQGMQWKNKLVAEGAEVTLLPMIEIIPMSADAVDYSCLSTADKVIIASQHALSDAILPLLTLIAKRKIPVFTMGRSITEKCEAYQIDPVYTAPIGSQSEDLLQSSDLQASKIKGQSIVLLVGEGGRTLIADTLSSRAAKVYTLKTYIQKNKVYELAPYFEIWQASAKKICFVATSGNILENWINQGFKNDKAWCQAQPLIVISDRLSIIAQEYGFQHIINTKGANFQRVLNTLHNMSDICHTIETS